MLRRLPAMCHGLTPPSNKSKPFSPFWSIVSNLGCLCGLEMGSWASSLFTGAVVSSRSDTSIHLLPSKDYIHAISLGVRLVLLSPSPLSLSEGLALAFGAQGWNLSQSAGTALLLCGCICSTAALADDKWHLVCGLLEQKEVAGRDKLHRGSLGLKGALRVGHSLTRCCGSIWPNRRNMSLSPWQVLALSSALEKNLLHSFVRSLWSSCDNTPETEIPSEGI